VEGQLGYVFDKYLYGRFCLLREAAFKNFLYNMISILVLNQVENTVLYFRNELILLTTETPDGLEDFLDHSASKDIVR